MCQAHPDHAHAATELEHPNGRSLDARAVVLAFSALQKRSGMMLPMI